VHYVPTDKINSSIRIRMQQILKVKILIRRMRILTSFVTSLLSINQCTHLLPHHIECRAVWSGESCLSVHLLKACIVTKQRKDLSRFLYYTKDQKNGWWGATGNSFYLKFWVSQHLLELNHRF